MKNIIKKLIPNWALGLYQNRNNSIFRNMNTKEVFTEIYNNNHWGSSESISGSGSEINQTESLINDLDKLLKEREVKSILDIPCGDFNWMQKVNLSNINYVGADIVEELINSNNDNYKNIRNIEFKVLDIITDPLPKSDIILVRDCLVHLSYKDIHKAIQNIKASGSKYLLTTTFTNHLSNYDIITGGWRPLNLQVKPFNLSAPILIINENCPEADGKYVDKSLALWEITKI